VKTYLAIYNAVAFVFWALYLIRFISSGLALTSAGLMLLNIAQGLAVLEIIHAALRWVKSPVGSTIAQVSSRLLVLVLINVFTRDITSNWLLHLGIVICSFAWGITELVRYSFYFLSLYGRQPNWLLWMRYTFFIVLYPLGVSGEWMVLMEPVVVNEISFNAYTVFLAVALVAYVYYFPVLYKYMWKQRAARVSLSA
jgi:very-long-chain (3R)-3-hydroxyacyl-CoA dehydratase